MVMSTRVTSACVDTGRRVVVDGLVLFLLNCGGWRCGRICSCTEGFFVAVVLRGGSFAEVVLVTNGALVGRLVITEMGLRVVAVVVVGRLVVVITAVWSVLTVWNVVNSSRSIVIIESWVEDEDGEPVDAAAAVDSNGTLVDGLLEVVVEEEPVVLSSSFWTAAAVEGEAMDGSLVESVAKTVVPVLIATPEVVCDGLGLVLTITPEEVLIISNVVLAAVVVLCRSTVDALPVVVFVGL